jgi:hypothetical protein
VIEFLALTGAVGAALSLFEVIKERSLPDSLCLDVDIPF